MPNFEKPSTGENEERPEESVETEEEDKEVVYTDKQGNRHEGVTVEGEMEDGRFELSHPDFEFTILAEPEQVEWETEGEIESEEQGEITPGTEEEPVVKETEEERERKIEQVREELKGGFAESEYTEGDEESRMERYIRDVAGEYNDLQEEHQELKEKRNLQEDERDRLIEVEGKFRDLQEEILETISSMSREEIDEIGNKNFGFRNDRLRAVMNEVLDADLPVLSDDLITKEVEGRDTLYVDYKEPPSLRHKEGTEETQKNQERLAEARYNFFDKMQEAVREVNELDEEQKEELRSSDEYEMLVDIFDADNPDCQAVEDVFVTTAASLENLDAGGTPIYVEEEDYPEEAKDKLDEKYNSSPKEMEKFMEEKYGGALRRMILHKVAKEKGYLE